jgi:hypothetical protein
VKFLHKWLVLLEVELVPLFDWCVEVDGFGALAWGYDGVGWFGVVEGFRFGEVGRFGLV